MAERYYKRNTKTAGDRHTESFDEWGVLNSAKDDGNKPVKHDVVAIGSVDTLFTDSNWRPGPVGTGGGNHPKGDGYSIKPVEPISRTSKGQRKTLGVERGDQWEE